ncbi:alpha/beta hydrolase [Paeniglutamicibacter psychrophenolicus]|uniref:Acetyl esterase n=1 Tax=Paeniglutamicibacter psychrophenolicus TaxID=257454 RepID=A0ABS4W7H3_9MICC|nr:alpha/beta hydrolase [Paeniglutamicibacter psychrophenolicus]MBP2372157.1 acetyl esterase [Paeniglutamicibacter psychrophenolicus]
MALDEATTALLRAAQNSEAVPFHSLSPVEARRQTSARGALAAPGPELEETRDLLLSVAPDAEIRMRIHKPSLTPRSVVLYLHGGGWVLGGLDSHDSMARNLAKSSGATIVMAEYRKAPEHPFPVPVDDSWAAFEWMVENREVVAAPEAAMYVAGDSAGGNLAAVVAHRSRDTGVGKLAGQILIYPVVDHDLTRPSYLAPENQTLLPVEAMEYFWGHYLQDPFGRSHPEASPLKREDLSGLPPALIITAEHDVLRDEGEHYARALSAAGVDVELHRWQGQMHGFIQMVGILPASLEVTELIASRISENEKVESEA